MIRNKKQINIDVFVDTEAVSFLLRRTGIDDSENALELAQRLGFLPLALEQAGAYIAAPHAKTDFASYIVLLERNGLLVFERNKGIIDYKLPVTATWQISMQKIEEQGAKQLLNMIAYFAPDDIPIVLFEEFAEYLPEPLKSDMQNGLKMVQIVGELTRYSLVKEENGNLFIHRLLQEIIMDNIEAEEFLGYCLHLFFSVCIFEKNQGYRDFHRIVLHILTTMENVHKWKTHTNERKVIILTILAVLANLFYHIGGYRDAETYYLIVIKSCEASTILVGNSELIDLYISAYVNLSLMYGILEEYEQAKKFALQGIRATKKHYGIKSLNVMQMYDYMAKLYENSGDFASAIKWCTKAMKLKKKVWGPDHHITLLTQSSIVQIYEKLDQVEAAEGLRKVTWEAWKRIPREVLDEYPIYYDNYAELCRAMGYYDEAIYWLKEKMRLNSEKYGASRPEVVELLFAIGFLYRLKGEYQPALENYELLLKHQLKNLGENHPLTKRTLEEIQICKERLIELRSPKEPSDPA